MLDLAIVGGGPAGLTAGLYATRGGLKNVVMFEKGMPGGQITQSSEIENYPGVCEVKTGMELMECWPEQCKRFGLVHEMDEVLKVAKNGETFTLFFYGDKKVEAKSVIIATGGRPRRAGFENEDKYWGRGVSTCATCDGFFYKNKEVAVLGGGDTALEEALYLANICSKVYLIHRREGFRASPNTVSRVQENPKIELILKHSVKGVEGDNGGVNKVLAQNIESGAIREIHVPGIFVFVGYDINNQVLLDSDGKFLCDMTQNGEIKVNLKMHTSLEGLFAAGDVREDAPKQVVCAASDGAIAALQAIAYLEERK